MLQIAKIVILEPNSTADAERFNKFLRNLITNEKTSLKESSINSSFLI